jgi:hypothetical protein
MKINNYINHIVFVIDRSGSMQTVGSQVVTVFDNQIKYLAQRSKELDQETRVSVYLFDHEIDCLIYDKDVLRLPSLKGLYVPRGRTALIDASLKSFDDLSKTPELYGDHSFLVYVLTDGENNVSNHLAPKLKNKILGLPENWTVGVLVPDAIGVREAKSFGFPADNIKVWSTDARGLEHAGENIKEATERFFVARSKGVRGTKSLFSVDLAGTSKSTIKNNLSEPSPLDYLLLPVHQDAVIKPFVESWTQAPYRSGSSYYQLVKPEKIQNYKQVCIQERATGKLYSGPQARNILKLPDHEIQVSPGDFGAYDIFIQSTAVNRKLPKGTKLVILK